MIYLWVRTAWEDDGAPTLRARIREIALGTWAAIDGARLAEWEEIPDGALMVPCDEHDWFAPRLGRELEEQWAGETIGCSWPQVTIGGRRVRLRPPRGYALVKNTRAWDAACDPNIAANELRGAPRLDVKLGARVDPRCADGRTAARGLRGAPAWCRPHVDALAALLDEHVPLA